MNYETPRSCYVGAGLESNMTKEEVTKDNITKDSRVNRKYEILMTEKV